MGQRDIVSALWAVLSELVDGAEADVAWVLNPGDPGLLKSLDNLSAEQASAITTGGASIAAHVEHLRYGLELLNRWSRGGEPFSDADYAASWRLTAVSETEWASKKEALRTEAYAWREAIRRDCNTREPAAVVASIAHLAYHIGAIRQIDPSSKGPSARD